MRITIGGDARVPVSTTRNLGLHPGATPIMLAAALGDLVQCDRAQVTDLEMSDDRGWVPLTFAAACGRSAAVRLLLSKCTTHLDVVTPQGHTPLMMAAQNDHTTATHELLKAGATVDQDDQMGYQALHFATLSGINNGVCTAADHTYTPTIHSIPTGNIELVELLLAYGANPNHAEQVLSHPPPHTITCTYHPLPPPDLWMATPGDRDYQGSRRRRIDAAHCRQSGQCCRQAGRHSSRRFRIYVYHDSLQHHTTTSGHERSIPRQVGQLSSGARRSQHPHRCTASPTGGPDPERFRPTAQIPRRR